MRRQPSGRATLTSSEANGVLQLRRDQVTWRDVDGEIIVLDKASASYFAINKTAVHLWHALEAGTTRGALIAELVSHYEIEESQAAADVDDFVARCRASDLLEP